MERQTIQQAIAHVEGWYAVKYKPTLSQRNNNPGNIRYGEFAKEHGGVLGDAGFARFTSGDAGFAALTALLGTKTYREMTVAECIHRYAPLGDGANDPELYVRDVCRSVGCTAETLIRTLL